MSGFPRPYGRYVLDERIAMGGMAEIFRARTATQGFEKRVCIKRILPHFLEDAEFVSMFRDEARTAAKLQHANVVQVFDFGEEEGTLYLAMELVDGADLRRVLETAKKRKLALDVGAVIQIGIDVSRGLHHAHTLAEGGRALGIVHRDISPHNILMSRAGEVKVTDFGIAKAAERSTHTGTGIVKGKVAYMAPEQAEGLAFDHRLDQFAVGVVLWEALCGSRLFSGDSDIATLRKVLLCEVPAPSSMRDLVPAALDEVILRTLAKDPAARFPDMRALELALSRVLYAGSLDPASADLRTQFSRIMDREAAPSIRKTQVAVPATDEAAPKPLPSTPLTSSETVTSSDPNLLPASGAPSRTDQEAREQPSSDVSRVFSSSGKNDAARGGAIASDGASNPLAQALRQSGAAAPANAPTVAEEDPRLSGAAEAPHSAPVPDRAAFTRSDSNLSLSAAAQEVEAEPAPIAPQDGTPATRTHFPRASGPSPAAAADVTIDDGARLTPLTNARAPALHEPGEIPAAPRRNLRAAAIGTIGGLALAGLVAVLVNRDAPADPTPPPTPSAVPDAGMQHIAPIAAPIVDAVVPVATAPDAGSSLSPVLGIDDPEPVSASPRVSGKKTGKLRLAFNSAVGWGHVTIDGKPRGDVDEQQTFLLPVGKHRVRVQNPSAKLDREFTVEVSADGVRSYSAVSGAFEGAR
jgi:serine/threonine protein kinase